MPRTVTFQELTSELSTEQLVKRLKVCQKNLEECNDLEGVNVSEVHSLAKSLIQPFVLSHRSREVRGLASCCTADIFRVCLPEPPYDESEIKEIFESFVNQLQGLQDPASPAFMNSSRLLETLADIQLFNLCLDMEDQDILTDIFRKLFSVVSPEQSTKVKNYIIDILSSLVQNGESLPQEVIDIVFSNILRQEPEVDGSKTIRGAAYAFTVEFIRRTSSHIEPYIHLYFNNALVVGKDSESEVSEHLYDLILELHAIDSSVLLAVMPQLEFKLKSTDTDERLEVTMLLAKMFSLKTSKLAVENRPLWNCFLGRFADFAAHIRIHCIESAKNLLLNHPHLVEDVASKLHERFFDKEEKVRSAVVETVCKVAGENFDVLPKTLCDDLKERMRDKVWHIRKLCINSVARIYRQLMSSSFSSGGALNSVSLKKLQWIPTKILHCYYRDSADDRLCVERCLLSCIVPDSLPDPQRMERMVHVYYSLEDEHAVRAFDALLLSRHRIRLYFRKLIETQQSKLESDEKKQSLLTQVMQMARHLPDPSKCQAVLEYLSKEQTLRESLLSSMDTSLSCAEVMKARMDVMKKFQAKVGSDTVQNLLDRACPRLIDANCIKLLVSKVCSVLNDEEEYVGEEGEEDYLRAKKALHLLRNLATIMPGNFRSPEVSEKLVTLLENEDKENVTLVLRILTLAGAHTNKKTASSLESILMRLAQDGDPIFTKDAVRCIHNTFGEKKAVMEKLCSSLVGRLDYEDDNLEAVLISLAQVARLQPQIFDSKQKVVIKEFVVKQLMVTDRAENEFVAGTPEWAPDDEISRETKMKVLGMKLLVEWLLGMVSIASKPVLKQKVGSVLSVLVGTLECDGDLQAQDNIAACDRSRLRLAAACGLVKLAKSNATREFISMPMFQTLALVVQDSCEEVREKFLDKLHKGLQNMQLPLWYLSIMVYVGTEPSKALRVKFRKLISVNATKRRQYMSLNVQAQENSPAILPENAMSYAVYLIAHHPQFSRTNTEELDKFKECIWFFLEPIVIRGQSYSFIVKLLDTIKLTVDAQDPKNSEAAKNLYCVCDLTKGVMEGKLRHLNLGTISGEVALPSTLFQLKGESSQPNTIRYLPLEYNCVPTKRPRVEESKEYPAKKSKQATGSKPTRKNPPPKQQKKAPPARRSGRSKGAAPSGPSPLPSEEEEEEEEEKPEEVEDNRGKAVKRARTTTRKTRSKVTPSDPSEEDTEVEQGDEEEEKEKEEGGTRAGKKRKGPSATTKRTTTKKTRSKVAPSEEVTEVEQAEEEEEEGETRAGRKRKGPSTATKKTTTKKTRSKVASSDLPPPDAEMEQAEEEEEEGGAQAGKKRKDAPATTRKTATRKTKSKVAHSDPPPEDAEIEQAEEEEEEGGTKTGKKGKSVPKKTTTRKTRSKIAPSSEENAEMEQAEAEEEVEEKAKAGKKGPATTKKTTARKTRSKATPPPSEEDTEMEQEEEEEKTVKAATTKSKGVSNDPPSLSEGETEVEQGEEEEEESRNEPGRKRPARATGTTKSKVESGDSPLPSEEVVEEEPAAKIKRRATRRRR